MVPKVDRDVSAEEFAATLRQETQRVSGATLAVFATDWAGGMKQLQIEVRGTDPAAVNAAADRVLAEVKQVPNAVDISLSSKGQKPELNVELHRGVAGSLGITVGQVAQALRPRSRASTPRLGGSERGGAGCRGASRAGGAASRH